MNMDEAAPEPYEKTPMLAPSAGGSCSWLGLGSGLGFRVRVNPNSNLT